ncbi:MAG: hypothetical protein GX053_06590 [Tissierella sp.]|nr:hypothetical protein [Tissierella sp.]
MKLKTTSFNVLRLVLGLFVFAAGSVCVLNAAIGVAPWDVLHQGVSNVTGITVGRANIYSGVIIIVIDILLGQAIGWGTLANMYLIGTFIDLLMLNSLIPSFESFVANLILLFVGIVLHGLGVYLYIAVGWGAGPRDGLMVVLTNRTGKSVRLIKSSIEVCVVAVGFLLGGNLGVGTVIMAILSGPIWQYLFKLLNFNVSTVEHRFIQDDILLLKEKFIKADDVN